MLERPHLLEGGPMILRRDGSAKPSSWSTQDGSTHRLKTRTIWPRAPTVNSPSTAGSLATSLCEYRTFVSHIAWTDWVSTEMSIITDHLAARSSFFSKRRNLLRNLAEPKLDAHPKPRDCLRNQSLQSHRR